MAGLVALFFNCWNLFVRLADPNHHNNRCQRRSSVVFGEGAEGSRAEQVVALRRGKRGVAQIAANARSGRPRDLKIAPPSPTV
jgi:hypothetical protein